MEWSLTAENEVLDEKSDPMPLCPPQIPYYWPGHQPGDVRNIGLGDLEWTDVGPDRNLWQVLVNLVVEFWFHKEQVIL